MEHNFRAKAIEVATQHLLKLNDEVREKGITDIKNSVNPEDLIDDILYALREHTNSVTRDRESLSRSVEAKVKAELMPEIEAQMQQIQALRYELREGTRTNEVIQKLQTELKKSQRKNKVLTKLNTTLKVLAEEVE